MLGVIIDKIQKDHGDDAVTGTFIAIISELKKRLKVQQKELDKIKKQYDKLEKSVQSKKKKKDNAFPYFNAVYIGETNKKKLPHGKGTLVFQSRDKDYPDDNDFYVGEFFNGTKTGIGKYTYFNDRNVAQHPFTIPYYIGEWSGDSYYGLGSTIMDKFETIHTYEGEYKNNKTFGFGKWIDQNNGKGNVELIGYFDDGQAVGFGLRITKDENGKIIPDFSGLCEYDNSDPKNKKSIIHFSFPDESFWEVVSDEEKTKPIVKTIFDMIIDEGYFKQDLSSKELQKLKLKAQSQHVELMFETSNLLEKNDLNSDLKEFLRIHSELKNNLFLSSKIEEVKKLQISIKDSFKDFKALKKNKEVKFLKKKEIKLKVKNISRNKMNYEFDCGDLWTRRKASKWSDLDVCLDEYISFDLKSLNPNFKIKNFDLKLNYTLPDNDQIKLLKPNQKYKITKRNKHFIRPIYYDIDTLFVDESLILVHGETICLLAEKCHKISSIHFGMRGLEGEIFSDDYIESEEYVQKKLKQKDWWLGLMEVRDRIDDFGEHGNDLDVLLYLREQLDQKIKFNFTSLTKPEEKILKKHKII